ncbi:MAG: NADP oxidoreductase [Nitriliruptorales bacterium]|nr:NADP oxidoreductase [Nitriliruptorales bacterium]
MRLGVLGTGRVGRTLSEAMAQRGNDVTMGARDPSAVSGREADGELFEVWLRRHDGVRVASFADAAANGEMVFNATAGAASLDALHAAGEQSLRGKILVDVANPLDLSGGVPPTLTVANTDSLAEQIQRAFPQTRVVKALNTVNAAVMVNPAAVGQGDHDLFVCGDDGESKAAVKVILRDWFGWRTIHDLGGIDGARAMEMYLALWIRLMRSTGSASFNVKVVS